MNEQRPLDLREDPLRATAQAFLYPPTPDLAGAVRRRLAREAAPAARSRVAPRRIGWAVLALAVLLVALLVAPRAEALVRAIFQIGSIQIVLVTPTPSPAASATPGPTPPPPASLLDLAGATTLAAAQGGALPVRLPTYPADLGPPDRVYMQDLDGPALILVWLVPGHPDQVRLALYAVSSSGIGEKLVDETTVLQTTMVHGQPAVWIQGRHMLQFYDRSGQLNIGPRRLVEGDVLAWAEGGITYRLESTLALDEARRVAESLSPVPAPLFSPTPVPTLTPLPSPVALASLGGETTLAAARQRVVYPIRLPTNPADLGQPDHVYLQELNGQTAVILVWLVPGQVDQVRLALYYIPGGTSVEKEVSISTTVLQKTVIDGQLALWVQGPHMLRFYGSEHPEWRAGRLVNGNVLIWAQSWLTFRLETTLSLDEARRIAESLR